MQCSSFIPKEYRETISSVPPPSQAEVGALMAFGTAQTGQLDKANDRIAGIFAIEDNCEAVFAKAAQQIQSSDHWWEFWK